MKGIFDPYVLWPFDKKLIFWLLRRAKTRDYKVILYQLFFKIHEKFEFGIMINLLYETNFYNLNFAQANGCDLL